MRIAWTAKAQDDLKKLPDGIADRIVKKMDWYVTQDDPLAFAKRLTSAEATFRFRVGDYRVLCNIDHGTISILFVLSVMNRKNAY